MKPGRYPENSFCSPQWRNHEKIQFYLDHRSYEQIKLGAVVFNNVYGYLGKTKDAKELIEEIKKQDIELQKK